MILGITKQYWQSILWFFVILYGSFTPQDSLDPRFYFFENQDKVIHALMYLILILLFVINYSKIQKPTISHIILFWVIMCSISMLIEILQPILSNRTYDLLDFASNSVGGIIGIITFKIFSIKKGNQNILS